MFIFWLQRLFHRLFGKKSPQVEMRGDFTTLLRPGLSKKVFDAYKKRLSRDDEPR